MTLDLRDELDRAASTLAPPNDLVGRARAAGQRRLAVRRRRAAIGGVAVAALFGVGIATFPSPWSQATRGHQTTSPAQTTTGTAQSVSPYGALVLRNGDMATAEGIVVARPGEPVRFCPSLPSVASIGAQGSSGTCATGVIVTGVDLASLADRSDVGGVITGSASLTGTYNSGTLTVTAQTARRLQDVLPAGTQPPCSPPPGGWPHGTPLANVDTAALTAYQQGHPGTVVRFALLRPSATQVVLYVLTDGDPAAIRSALQATYGNRLCVAASRYTAAQIRAAEAAFPVSASAEIGATIYQTFDAIASTGQIYVEADVAWVTPEMAARAAQQPEGLLRLHPWLAPKGASTTNR